MNSEILITVRTITIMKTVLAVCVPHCQEYRTDPPIITNLTYQEESHTLTCVSTVSPATTVSWMKDGQPLTTDGSSYYTLTQTVTDRTTSTYSNVLTVSEAANGGVAGTYTCTVANELGSNSSDLEVAGEFVYRAVHSVRMLHITHL